MRTSYSYQSERRCQMLAVTDEVKAAVAQSGVREGVCVVYTTDVDAGVMVTSFFDEKGHEDILDDLERIFPERGNFRAGSPRQGAAGGKSAVCGTSRDFPVSGGQVQLGGSEGIYLAEFDGPKTRQIKVKVLGSRE